jgi:hypothetical protein
MPSAIPLRPPQWKVALWSKDSIEPAMLRVPLILITFIALWVVNVWLLDKLHLPYNFVLGVKNSKHIDFFKL